LLEANAADPRRHSSTVGDKTFAEEASSGISSGMLSPVASSDAAHLNVSLSPECLPIVPVDQNLSITNAGSQTQISVGL
jgi:hypothetical protein